MVLNIHAAGNRRAPAWANVIMGFRMPCSFILDLLQTLIQFEIFRAKNEISSNQGPGNYSINWFVDCRLILKWQIRFPIIFSFLF